MPWPRSPKPWGFDMTPGPKRPAHRPPLPPERRQDAVIRERVTAANRLVYEAAGGKAWLLAQLDACKRAKLT